MWEQHIKNSGRIWIWRQTGGEMTVWSKGKYFGWILNIHNKWNFKPTDHASWGIYCASCKVSFCSFIFYTHPLYLCVNTLWNEFALQGPRGAGTRCAQTESGWQHKGGGGGHKRGGLRNESWGQGEGQERHSDNGRAGEEEAQAEFSSCGFALAPWPLLLLPGNICRLARQHSELLLLPELNRRRKRERCNEWPWM